MVINLTKQRGQVVLLYITTLVGVFLGVISSIVNTHYVAPSVYGDVRYVQNIINFISSLLLLGYFQSGSRLLALARDNEESRQIKGCMVIILIITSLILMISCLVCGFIHDCRSGMGYLFGISVPVCISPLLLNYVNTTAQGDNQISRISIARLVPSLIYVPVAFLLYKFTGATSTKMILLQWGVSSIILIGVIGSTRPKFQGIGRVWKKLLNENKEYGLQLYVGSLVMVATNYLAGISLGAFNADNSEVGFYTLALTVTTPLQSLPSIIGTTYFKQFAKQDRIPKRVMKATIALTVSSCLLFALCIKPLVYSLYSERYAQVGTYAIILAVGFSMHGFGDMLNRYLGSHGKGRYIRNASVANGVFKVIGYTFLVYFFNTMGALITTVICDAIYLICLLYYYRLFTSNINQ